MGELGLAARRQRNRKQTTRQGRGRWRAPDLIGRDFGTERLNHKWYGDGTEIPTAAGTLYLDSVLDMGSRRIVGFAVGEHHDADLAQAALQMAVAVRGGKDALTEVLMHTDQGSEYTARAFRAACGRVRITQSMGRAGSALDNAVIESWHSTVEFELHQLEHFTTKPGSTDGRGRRAG
jgi:putative transposase